MPPRPGLHRISPAKKDNSLLWLNVAAATLPNQWRAPRRAMPLGGLAPLSLDELEVLRLWIEAGAPREGVVPGSGELVDACLPPPEPLETKPLATPHPARASSCAARARSSPRTASARPVS